MADLLDDHAGGGGVAPVAPARIPGVLELLLPEREPAPLVLDSPHSGADYPDDFRHCMSDAGLRRLEDAFVDELFQEAPRHGASLLRALFPRSYIDPNRAPDDLDVGMLDEEWPHGANPGPKTESGIGLICRLAAEGPVYDRKLAVHEVRHRLERYYWPYHRALERVLDHTWRRFGAVLHVNCHSMKSTSTSSMPEGRGISRPDFVLGDRDGSACDPDLTERVRAVLVDAGYTVSVNSPYKGMELVRRYSDPGAGRHSLQVEINRALYMDEQRVRKADGFEQLQRGLGDLVGAIVGFMEEAAVAPAR
jgi:N-formylglutamate deformylase